MAVRDRSAARPASRRRPPAEPAVPKKPAPAEVRHHCLAFISAARAAMLDLSRQIGEVADLTEAHPACDVLDPKAMREVADSLQVYECELSNAVDWESTLTPDPGAFDRLKKAVGY